MSVNDVHVRAQKVQVHELSTVELSTYNTAAKHPHATFYVPRDYNVQRKYKQIVRQLPQTAFNPSQFLNAQSTDIKLERGLLSQFTHAYVQVKITNSTGAGVTLAPTPFWFNRIEILGPDNSVLTSIYGQELYLSLAFLNRNEFEQMATYMGTTTAYSTAGTALANGASGIYYLPLWHLFSAAKLHLEGLKGDLTIRLITQQSSMVLIAGTHPTVTEVSLIMKGFNEPSAKRAARSQLYNCKMPYKLPYTNFIRSKDSPTLAASSSYSSLLTTFQGSFIGMFVSVRPAGYTAATQGTYQALSSFDLQLASGESLLGHYVRLHEDNKIECAELFNNVFANNKDWYFIAFSPDPAHDYIQGSVHGYQVLTGTEKFTFTTPAGLAPGPYEIDFYALSAEHLHIDHGRIIAKK